ncbi:MAG: hypothetical protein KDB15_17645, partial [Microthrixaceae bacterium]|nr:hypothetical protein [Microthrixaceae bacterium]
LFTGWPPASGEPGWVRSARQRAISSAVTEGWSAARAGGTESPVSVTASTGFVRGWGSGSGGATGSGALAGAGTGAGAGAGAGGSTLGCGDGGATGSGDEMATVGALVVAGTTGHDAGGGATVGGGVATGADRRCAASASTAAASA